MQSKAEFLQIYGGIYEHSPWIAEAAFDAGARTIEEIHAAMKAAVDNAAYDKKLALIKAHPELGSRVRMAEASVQEQSGAGFDRCTPQEFAEFQKLNAEYNAKFGFPFIVAVKGLTRQDILSHFRRRLNSDVETEFKTALEQIHKIARFRLSALQPDGRLERANKLAEDGHLQVLFLRSLVLGVLNWLILCPIFFLLDGQHDLVSFLGIVYYISGAIFVGPVFSLLIYTACKVMYAVRKHQHREPHTAQEVNRLSHKANLYALPVILLVSWAAFSLYYSSFESYTQSVSGAVHP